jgi:Tfp pilus assembly protein PilF
MLALTAQQFDTAAEFFDLAIQVDPAQAAEMLLVWGLELLYADRPTEAVEVFRRGADDPLLAEDAARFNYFLARAFRLDDQIENALAAARKAAEQEEDVPMFGGQVGWILYEARRYDEAIEAFRALIEEFDSYRGSSEIRDVLREARLAISSLYVIKEDNIEAEEWLQQVLDEYPNDVGASNDLGYLWADQGIHLDRALRMIQHAVSAEPDNAAYIDSLGWVFYRLGRYDEAVVELQRAVAAEDGPDPVILDHLGDAHFKVNQPEEARQAWHRAVEAFNERNEPEKARQVQQKADASEQGIEG